MAITLAKAIIQTKLNDVILGFFSKLVEVIAPAGIIEVANFAVIVPVLPAFVAGDLMHKHIRTGIIRRQRRVVSIIRIVITAALIHLDREAGQRPLGALRFFENQLLHLRQRGSLTWILLGRHRLDGDTLVLSVLNRETDLIWKRD